MKKFNMAPESMDFLLDAMCNVLGAVIFMAILLGAISGSAVWQAQQEAQSALSAAEAARELHLLDAQLTREKARWSLYRSLADMTPAPPDTADPAWDEKRYFQQAQEANLLADELQELHRRIQDAERRKHWLQDAPQQDLAEIRSEIGKYTRLLQQQQPPRFFPASGSGGSNLQPVRLLVTEEGFYPIGTNSDIRRGNRPEAAIVIDYYQRNDMEYWQLRKKPGRASDLTPGEIARYLKGYDPQQYFVEIFCEPNAVSAGAMLLNEVRRQGFGQNFRVVSTDGALVMARKGGVYRVAE